MAKGKGGTPEDELRRAAYNFIQRYGIPEHELYGAELVGPDGAERPRTIDYSGGRVTFTQYRDDHGRPVSAPRSLMDALAERAQERRKEFRPVIAAGRPVPPAPPPPRVTRGSRAARQGQRPGTFRKLSDEDRRRRAFDRQTDRTLFALEKASRAPAPLAGRIQAIERGGKVEIRVSGIGRGNILRPDTPDSVLLDRRAAVLRAESKQARTRASSARTAPARARAAAKAQAITQELRSVASSAAHARRRERRG